VISARHLHAWLWIVIGLGYLERLEWEQLVATAKAHTGDGALLCASLLLHKRGGRERAGKGQVGRYTS
jgi:hypothetical protein